MMEFTDSDRVHTAALRPYLAGCTVLLKKDGSFPLSSPCPLALFGSGARRTVKGGTGSGEVNSRSFVSIEQGLEDAGFVITSKDWLAQYDLIRREAQREFIRAIKERARQHHTLSVLEGMGAVMPEPEYDLPLNAAGSAAVYVLSRTSGEGNDRAFTPGDILLTETETRDILTLQRSFSHFLLVLNVGGPVDLSPVLEAGNILLLSQLGTDTGAVLADLLLGKAVPSGKLSTSWVRETDLPKNRSFGDPDETDYREGIYVGYRYLDSSGREPLFPFGYGLSYTDFSLGESACSCQGEQISVSVPVTNTGSLPGREVVQLYVSVPAGKLDQPYQALAAFAKTPELKPGETAAVQLSFPLSQLASFDADRACRVLEPGEYILRLGTSSRNTRPVAAAVLSREVITEQLRPALGSCGFKDLSVPRRPEALPAGLPRLEIDPAAVPFRKVSYGSEPEPDVRFAALPPEQLAFLGIGAFDPKAGIQNVIGEASSAVAGAAGQSCSRPNELGLPSLVMADGPAGLRLAPDYYINKKGAHALSPAMPESMAQLLPKPAELLLSHPPKAKAGVQILHQYTTALPIGTALAQSFDSAFAELCGDIVGTEMHQFGVHLWLAPALNIHRDIRCGRNFEYYSEDPLLAGRMAAAVTRGVQKHSGCGVCIKHFAANNQETNRYGSNSLVSQRAMREIYLRAFELCVREAQPASLMTSYNLLNGVHTSERRDLIQDILRSEFGFEGLVMTDWVISAMGSHGKYGPPARPLESSRCRKRPVHARLPGGLPQCSCRPEGRPPLPPSAGDQCLAPAAHRAETCPERRLL